MLDTYPYGVTWGSFKLYKMPKKEDTNKTVFDEKAGKIIVKGPELTI